MLLIIDAPDDLEQLMAPPGLKEACRHAGARLEQAKTMRITNDAGTDLTVDLGFYPTMVQYGFAELPGRFDHWGGGHVHTFPNEGSAHGTVVIQPGDIVILPYCRYVQDAIRLEIRDGHIRKIEGGLDATLMRQWLDDNKRKHRRSRRPRRLASRLGPQSAGALGCDRAPWRRCRARARRGPRLRRKFSVLDRPEHPGRRHAQHQGPLRRADARLQRDARQRPGGRSRPPGRSPHDGRAGRALTVVHLAVDRIAKRFDATQALRDVSLTLAGGAIHALVGENGAGKSTLIKILGGQHQPDSGRLVLDGAPRAFADPRAALAAGIVVIPQELRLVPALSVAENIMLGHLPTRGPMLGGFMLDRAAMRARAAQTLARLGATLPLDARVDRLSYAERQLARDRPRAQPASPHPGARRADRRARGAPRSKRCSACSTGSKPPASRSSMSRTGWPRSSRSPITARCCATEAWSTRGRAATSTWTI
ncbi:MAG: ATP-binding cassette domain-containing protein [Pseudomonadota bacterium]